MLGVALQPKLAHAETMIILGMVGTPAAGKSTVAAFLRELGADWINADLIARDCLQDPEVRDALVARFGPSVVGGDDVIDRAKVADLVFGSDATKWANLQFLESLVHPRTRVEIRRRIVEAAKRDTCVALLDVPRLFESGWDRSCDAIWCIDASRENRFARSRIRGWDDSELDRREASQLAIETKCRLSNLVMRNDSTLEALHEKLRCHWNNLVRMESSRLERPSPESSRHCISDRTLPAKKI